MEVRISLPEIRACKMTTYKPLAIDFGSPNILYAGTRARGVLQSTNGGNTWSTVNISAYAHQC